MLSSVHVRGNKHVPGSKLCGCMFLAEKRFTYLDYVVWELRSWCVAGGCMQLEQGWQRNLTSETFVVTFAVEAAAYPCSEVSSCLWKFVVPLKGVVPTLIGRFAAWKLRAVHALLLARRLRLASPRNERGSFARACTATGVEVEMPVRLCQPKVFTLRCAVALCFFLLLQSKNGKGTKVAG